MPIKQLLAILGIAALLGMAPALQGFADEEDEEEPTAVVLDNGCC